MAEINEQYLPDEPENNLNDQSTSTSNDKTQRILKPADVAKRLDISERTAQQLMHELPHISISRDMYSARKRVRITEHTLEDYISVRIDRKRLRRAR